MHTNHCTTPGTSVWISFFTKPEVDLSPNFTLFSHKAMRTGKTPNPCIVNIERHRDLNVIIVYSSEWIILALF